MATNQKESCGKSGKRGIIGEKWKNKKVLSLSLAMLQVKNVVIIYEIDMFRVWHIKCVFPVFMSFF